MTLANSDDDHKRNLNKVLARENQRLRQELVDKVRASHRIVFEYQKKIQIKNNE